MCQYLFELLNDVKKLTYQYDVCYSVEKFPEYWNVNEMAGKDWFTSFTIKYTRLGIERLETTSLNRVQSGWNQNMNLFN